MSAPKRWHEDDVQSGRTDDLEHCSMFRGSWLFGLEQCEGAGTHTIRQACVHEHMHDYLVCAKCVERLKGQDMFCNACTDGAESHECKVNIAVLQVTS